ncbi:MAG: hypothetical protein JWM81_1172 [Candidatus Saccharibacteria bacterium]|nr:hypothetical protein [Candidatus Saccharibacteria bacterium]
MSQELFHPSINVAKWRKDPGQLFANTPEAAAFLNRRLSTQWQLMRLLTDYYSLEKLNIGNTPAVRVTASTGRQEPPTAEVLLPRITVPRTLGLTEGLLVTRTDSRTTIAYKDEMTTTTNSNTCLDVPLTEPVQAIERGMVRVTTDHESTFMTVNLLAEHGLEDQEQIAECVDAAFTAGALYMKALVAGEVFQPLALQQSS